MAEAFPSQKESGEFEWFIAGYAVQQIAIIDRQLAHISLANLQVNPDARVQVDGRWYISRDWRSPLPVDPGQHQIRVECPGAADLVFRPQLVAGQSFRIQLPPRRVTNSESADHGEPTWRFVGWTAGTLGLAALGVAAATGGLAIRDDRRVHAHCDLTTGGCDDVGLIAASDGRAMATTSTVTSIAGGALVLAGGITIYFSNHPHRLSFALSTGRALTALQLHGEL